MKVSEIKEYVSMKTFDELEVDISQTIERDEFMNGHSGTGDYRTDAIQKLKKMNVPFHSTTNNIYEFTKIVLQVKCIYCGKAMEQHGGGGNFYTTTIEYRCLKCKAKIHLTLEHDAIAVEPK